MQQTRAQFTSLKLLIIGLVAADVFAVWVWAARPPRIFSGWLGLADFRAEAPFSRLIRWASWHDGPRTPSGFVALFDLAELIIASLLLSALILPVILLLAPRESDALIWRSASEKVRALRFRMRTAVALVAIIGIYLGWEIHAWRTWRLRRDYLRIAGQASYSAGGHLAALRSIREERAYADGSQRLDPSARRVFYRSRAAKAGGIAVEYLKKQEVDLLLAKLAADMEGKLKYERAAAIPWSSVAPGRTPPETAKEASEWLHPDDYRRALALYDELARTYPDLVEAHSRSAWLRATRPDAQSRDGKLAVESARCACELTNWHDPGELEVLAAACAAAGDFGTAVKWQEKAVTLTVVLARAQSPEERLALYRAGKTLRQP
jgi:hypothetical protein